MANTDFVLTIEGVRGESKKKDENTPLEIEAFEYTLSTNTEGVGDRKGRTRKYSDVTFRKRVCKATPTIQLMLARNAKIEKVTLSARKASGDGKKPLEYYRLTLWDAYISTYKLDAEPRGGDHGDIPLDIFTVNFRKIEVLYDPQGDKGMGTGVVTFGDELNANA